MNMVVLVAVGAETAVEFKAICAAELEAVRHVVDVVAVLGMGIALTTVLLRLVVDLHQWGTVFS